MCRSLLHEVYISLLLSQILFIINEVHSAPKLGGVMIEQLLLETLIDNENNTNAHYKREFTVPAYHADIKNTTTLYAKLTGNSIRNSVDSASEHIYKESKVLDNTTNSPYKIANASGNNSTRLRKDVSTDTNTSSMSKLISVESPTTTIRTNVDSRVHDPEKPKDIKNIKSEQKIKVNTGVHKSKPNENVRRYAHSRNEKSRRDGAVLQPNGYAYNGDICQMRGERVICGYNNQELSLPAIESEPGNNDCLTRGDRIECGYAKSIADSNRRNINRKSAKENGPEILAFNVTSNLTTAATITSNTTYSTTVTNLPVPIATAEISPTNTASLANTKDEPDLSQLETEKLIDHIEKMISSIIMNSNISTNSPTITNTSRASPTSTIDNDPKISVSKSMELINRVEKIMAFTATNSTSSATLPISAIEFKLSKALEMLNRVEKKIQSLVSTNAFTHTTAATISTTNSTPISSTTTSSSPTTFTTTTSSPNTSTSTTTTRTTTSSTTTTSTTPETLIDEREFCVEKDGRIVCYDKTQEDYEEDFLEK